MKQLLCDIFWQVFKYHILDHTLFRVNFIKSIYHQNFSSLFLLKTGHHSHRSRSDVSKTQHQSVFKIVCLYPITISIQSLIKSMYCQNISDLFMLKDGLHFKHSHTANFSPIKVQGIFVLQNIPCKVHVIITGITCTPEIPAKIIRKFEKS